MNEASPTSKNEVERLKTVLRQAIHKASEEFGGFHPIVTFMEEGLGSPPEMVAKPPEDITAVCGNCEEAHHVLSAAGIADGDLAEKIDDLIAERDLAVEQLQQLSKLQPLDLRRLLERETSARQGKGYCCRCDARHDRVYCPDCGLKLIAAELQFPENGSPELKP